MLRKAFVQFMVIILNRDLHRTVYRNPLLRGEGLRGGPVPLGTNLQQALVLLATLLDEAESRRHLELPDLERAFFLYPNDDKAGGS